MSASVLPSPGSRDARGAKLWAAFVAAKGRADASLRLSDMKAAVAAYEAFLAAMVPDERARREVWP